jgi:hypothetical protein
MEEEEGWCHEAGEGPNAWGTDRSKQYESADCKVEEYLEDPRGILNDLFKCTHRYNRC